MAIRRRSRRSPRPTKGVISERAFWARISISPYIFIVAPVPICGEETAMLDSLEGKRAQPRLEAAVPGGRRALRQPDGDQQRRDARLRAAYRDAGRGLVSRHRPETEPWSEALLPQRAGRANPASTSLPMGIPLRELVENHGGGPLPGRKIKAVIPGGVSAPVIPASGLDVGMDFDLACRRRLNARLGRGDRDRRLDLHGQGCHPDRRVLPPRDPAANARLAAKG